MLDSSNLLKGVIMEYIDINDTVYNLCIQYPKIKDILCSLGFDKIKNPIMFNTIARKMTVYKAICMKNIDLYDARKKFNEYGFDFKDSNSLNIDERNDILKSLIVKLHNGEDIDNIKKEFEDKLIKVSALEVHNAMHELVENGMSIDEAKKFFYIRTLLLKDAMDNLTDNDYEAIEILKEENRVIEKILNDIKSIDDISLLKNLYDIISKHYSKKESLFFTALKKYGNDEPSKVMSKVDKDILNEIKNIIDDNDKKEKIETIKNHISDMIFKEENILVPLAVSVLNKDDFDYIRERYI